MKKKDIDTEEKILQVARKVFTQKGLAGARMQDIADEAGFNKALVHYYFGSKQKLFQLIFEQEFGKFFSNLVVIISSDIPLFAKIERIISLDIERLSAFPQLPMFVLNEISRNPGMMLKRFRSIPISAVLAGFRKQVNEEIKSGGIRKISAEQLLINIQSLSIFPFIAKPMLQTVFQYNEKEYYAMIAKRKKEVFNFIIAAIKA